MDKQKTALKLYQLISSQGTDKFHSLFNNICNNRESDLDYILNRWKHPHAKENGNRLLHKAVDCSNESILNALCTTKGINIDIINNTLFTPLLLACDQQKPHLCEILLKHNANPNTLTANNETGMHFATRHGNLAIMKLLVSNGFDSEKLINVPDSVTNTPLIYGVGIPSDITCFKYLLETPSIGKYIDLYFHNKKFHATCLSGAICFNQNEIVKYLINEKMVG